MPSADLAADDVIDALDSFYCHNVIVALWCDAAARLASRIGDLGGAITADPRQFWRASPRSSTRTRTSWTRYADATT